MKKKFLSLMLLVSFIISNFTVPFNCSIVYAVQNGMPQLIISEICPQTSKVTNISEYTGKDDLYEYIEIYNTTNNDIMFSGNYTVKYMYDGPNGEALGGEKNLKTEANVIIPTKKAVVFWDKRTITGIGSSAVNALTADDFKSYYETNCGITDKNYTVTTLTGQNGFSNSGIRGFKIVDSSNNVVSQASYIGSGYTQPSQISADNVIQYKIGTATNTDMSVYKTMSAPTPGNIDPVQAEMQTVLDNIPPTLSPSQVNAINAGSGADISTIAKDNKKIESVNFSYRVDENLPWTTVNTSVNESTYTAHVQSSELWTNKLQYYFTASDGVNTVRSDIYSAAINNSIPSVNPQTLPPILITEVTPNAKNVGSSDGYEFIEIYNNSDKPINMKDYSLRYRYPNQTAWSDLFWNPNDSDRNIIVQSGKTLVFWVINSENSNKTVDDFNKNYGTSLVENQDIVKIYCDGMSNTAPRTIVISTNSGKDISKASYLGSSDPNEPDVVEDMSLIYGYPLDGGIEQRKLSYGKYKSTPGTVLSVQVPSERVQIKNDTDVPVINYTPEADSIDSSNDFDISLDVTDDVMLNTLKFYYKTNLDSQYTEENIYNIDGSNQYNILVSSAQFIGKTNYSYYFEASDSVHTSTSQIYNLSIASQNDQSSPVRANINEGIYLKGFFGLKGTSASKPYSDISMYIDGKKIDAQNATLENAPKLAVDVKNTDFEFQNAITMGHKILRIIDEPNSQYKTYIVPIDTESLKTESGNLFQVRCGDKNTPFTEDDPTHVNNRDDFLIKNARLILDDGTTVYDAAYSNPTKELKIGDSTGMPTEIDFNFNLLPDYFKSAYSNIDTTKLEDGAHTLRVTDGINIKEIKFYVDNTAPKIDFNLKDGEKYKGAITIAPSITDNLSGIADMVVTLNDKPIKLPYETSSGKLDEGTYVIKALANDKAGNKVEKSMTFYVDKEAPNMPVNVTGNGEKLAGTDAKLTVNVSDPSNDKLNVSFFEGMQYKPGKNSFIGFANASDVEPPRQLITAGEKTMSEEDYAAITSKDGNYLETNSSQFPYQRFEIAVDPSISDNDRINVKWTGKSLNSRKVTLYAWNIKNGCWDTLDYKISDGNDFTLQQDVKKGNYVTSDNKLNVLVQDEVQNTNTNSTFTFAWFTDTQYYNASYPDIINDQIDWVLQNRNAMNIKYVIHTGDIVDNSHIPSQWVNANAAFKKFDDAKMPYGVLAGNHDVNHVDNDYTYFYQNFGEDRFKNQETFGESYKNNRGHYDLVSVNGVDFIIVYMGWDIEQDEYDWMNSVLAKYPSRKAIVCVHEYLSVDGTRYAIGQGIFDNVVRKSKNVIAVLSGHYHGASRKIDKLDDNGDGIPDRTVYQMLSDYQSYDKGGDGYLRLLQFDCAANKINIKTYSPYLNDYNLFDNSESNKDEYGYQDEFSIPVDLTTVNKQVATDSLEVNVYTKKLIKNFADVKSGSNVSADWNNLKENSNYQWYVQVKDDFDGETASDVWNFNTGISDKNVQVIPSPNPSQPNSPSEPNSGSNDIGTGGSSDGKTVDKNDNDTGTKDDADKGSIFISAEQIMDSLKNIKDKTLILKADVDTSKKSTIVNIPLKEIKAAVGDKIEKVTLKAGNVTVTASKEEISGFAAKDGKNLQLVIEQADEYLIPNSIKNKSAGNKLLSIYFAIDGNKIYNNSKEKNLEIEISYNPKEGENAGSILVYGVDDKGNALIVKNGRYDEKNGKEVFRTDNLNGHFIIVNNVVTFNDLSNTEWGRESIEALAGRGIISGIGNGKFNPTGSVTRAEFIKILMETLELTDSTAISSFSDVKEDQWYYNVVATAQKLGIVKGKSGSSFGANDEISRQDMAVMVYRAAQVVKVNLNNGTEADEFEDAGRIASYAKEAVTVMQQAGIIVGVTGGNFSPTSDVTRVQAAAIIYRLGAYLV